MTGMTNEMRDFLTNQSGADKEKAQKAIDKSSSTQSSLRINVSGVYRVRVRNFYATKNNVVTVFPKVEVSSRKKSLMLTIMLETVDSTDLVPAGSTILHNITMIPAPGSSDELYVNTAKMSKPQLCALLGVKDLNITDANWMYENICVDYDEKGKMIKDHKMTCEIMAEVIDEWYNNTLKQKVNGGSIRPATATDKSKSNTPANAESQKSDGTVIKSDDSREDVDNKVIQGSALAGIGDDKLVDQAVTEDF